MSTQSTGAVDWDRLVKTHLAVLLVVTCVTAWFSYAYFHPDEYFQVIEYARSKLGFVRPEVLPWEHAQRMRPWLQPAFYFLIGRGLGIRDVFAFAFVCRLVTGLLNFAALAMFLRTTLPWYRSDEEKMLHLRVVTCLGFLPYLFVRTSSESGSMAALTAAFALLLEGAREGDGRRWTVPSLERAWRLVFGGVLFGVAFECRFQTAIFALGLLAWLRVVGGASFAALGRIVLGGTLSVLCGALIDRWGYGTWTFPPWTYFEANLLEGAASLFGSDPLLSYFWKLPANVFAPVVLTLLVLMLVAWSRCPRHPVTWVTLPFLVIHSLISHKEERFIFPIAVVSTALVTMALGPSFGPGRFATKVTERVARWGWERRWAWPGKLVALMSTAGMVLLAFFAIGWNHNVRFTRFLHDAIGNEVRATALPEIPLPAPAFHPPIYEIDKADPDEVARRIAAGQAREWLITDRSSLVGTSLDGHAVLVFSELPFFRYPAVADKERMLIDAYNARAPMMLRRLHFRSLYRIVP